MFFYRTALLICKAHVNAGSVTCHSRGRRSINRVASGIYESPSFPLDGGREKQPPFFILLAAGSDIIYFPRLMATHPPTHSEKDKTQTFKAQRGTYQFKTKKSTICNDEIVRTHN